MEENINMDVNKEEFCRNLYDLFNQRGPNTYLLSHEKYYRMVEQIKMAKTKTKRTPADYLRVKKYEVKNMPDGERLFAKPTVGNNRVQMLVTIDETYDIIRDYHLKLNHGGRSRMMIEIKRKYRNITTQSVLLYLSMCMVCKNKLVIRGKSKPSISNCSTSNIDSTFEEITYNDPLSESSAIAFKENNEEEKDVPVKKYPELYSRGQVDILSVTNDINEEYKYLMVYRNLITKFINLKSMKALCVDEIVDGLLEIFLVFGAPNILQSKNGISVIKPICRRISTLCPDIKVVIAETKEQIISKNDFKGKSNEDILKKLNEWLIMSQNTKWQEGVKYVQHSLNTEFHEVLCRTPNELVFGVNPRKGLASFLTRSCYEDLLTEQDLISVLDEKEGDQYPRTQLKLEESLMLPSNFIKLESDLMGENIEDEEHLE